MILSLGSNEFGLVGMLCSALSEGVSPEPCMPQTSALVGGRLFPRQRSCAALPWGPGLRMSLVREHALDVPSASSGSAGTSGELADALACRHISHLPGPCEQRLWRRAGAVKLH